MEHLHVSLVLVLLLALVSLSEELAPRRPRWVVDDTGCRTPDKGVGDCIKIFNCQPMTNFIASKEQFSKEEIAALLSYQCGVENNETKVCCPNEPITLDWLYEETETCMDVKDCKIIYDFIKNNDNFSTEIKEALRKYVCSIDKNGGIKVNCPNNLPPEFEQARGPADDSQHVNYKLLPNTCGVSGSIERIINGNLTSLYEFPWAVALKYDREDRPYSCGGSLISNRYVLTAAHCINTPNKLIGVRIGEHNFNTEPDCENNGDVIECADPPQDFEIELNDTVVHEDYSRYTLQNDIALIRLRRPANTTVYSVSAICLPITVEQKTKSISNYTAIGWGITEKNTSSSVLLKVLLPKEELPKCAQKYALRKTELSSHQMCAGGKNGEDTCVGDSGGPLSGEYASNGQVKVIQYGIVSFGPTPCGVENLPGVYTRVDKYTKWILDHLKP